MTTITLELPDELARQLDGFNLVELLQLGLTLKQVNGADAPDPSVAGTMLDEEADSPAKPLAIYPPLIPDGEFELVPPAPLPKKRAKLCYEEWMLRLLSMPAWDEATIEEIEQAREYVNRWQPPTHF